MSKHDVSFYKTLFSIAVPIILQNFMQSCINMLDTIMVGQLGAAEIAAVGLGNQIFFLQTMIQFGIGSGASIFIAQYWGKKDIAGIRRTEGISLVFSVSIAFIFSAAAFFAPNALLSFFSKDAQVIEQGTAYLRTAAFSYPISAASFSFSLALRSTEQVKLPMAGTIASLFANAVLNYIFIFVCNFGVKGAAFGTVFSRIIEFIIIFGCAYKRKYPAAAKMQEIFSFSKEDTARYLRIAFPVIINETLWGGGVSMQNFIMAHAGTDAIAAFNITSTVSQLTWVFFIGCGNAAAIIIGKKIGENHEAEARSTANHFAWFMPLSAFFIGMLLIPLSSILPFFFKVDPLILQQARRMLLVLVCLYPFKSFNMCMIVGICRSGGDTVFAAAIDTMTLWCVSLPLGAIAAFLFHLPVWQIYVFLVTDEIIKSFAAFIRLRSGKWLHNLVKPNYH